MEKTLESTETCPYCGEAFYVPSDCADHVKAAHLDFGRSSRLNRLGHT